MRDTEDPHKRIDRLLNEADEAFQAGLWETARVKAGAVLALESNNWEAQSLLEAIELVLTGWDYKGPEFPLTEQDGPK